MNASARYGLKEVNEAVAALRGRMVSSPLTAILAGTGLGDMVDACEVNERIAYGEIPHFPASTVQSHAGYLVFGRLNGQPVAILQGRCHLYEGYGPGAVTFPIRVLHSLGVKNLVITNASGGLNPEFAAGDIMVIADHINLTGENPLVGPNEEAWGGRFPDMTAAYAPSLRQWTLEERDRQAGRLREGIYVGLKGPSLETPAEMRYLRAIGADAVGFSTVMECIAAVHGGMRVLGLSTITNTCRPDEPVPAQLEEIIAVARDAAPRLAAIIAAVLGRLSKADVDAGR